MRDASGLGIRSAGDLETGLFDLDDEIAGEAGLDAQGALDPLPRLGDDILVEPLAHRVVQRPHQKDRALIGYLEVTHVRDFRRSGMLRRRSPTQRAAMQGSAPGLRRGRFCQAASFKSAPAARSISRRLSLFGIDRACAVAATVTSQRVSIGRSSSTWWMALIGSTMLRPNRWARNASTPSWTFRSRAASIALMTGWADPSSYSLRTGATSSSQRSGAPFVWRMRPSVYWSAPHTMRLQQT